MLRQTRREQKEATAAAVLDAARAEFEEVGFEAAKLRSIAARAGVSTGSVLHHFSDKRDLLHAALFHDLEAVIASARKTIRARTLPHRLDGLAKAVFGYYARRPKLTRALVKESLFAEGDWALRFRDQTAAVHAAITQWVEEARARGEVCEDLDAGIFALAWLSYFYFALIAWVQGAHASPAQLVATLVGQQLHFAGARRVAETRENQGRSPR